jgi:hypothetical protein
MNLTTIKLFCGDFDFSDDGFANDAWHLLTNEGRAAESDATHGWDEVSGFEGGEEYVTLRTDADGIARLREVGFRVEAV